MSWAVADLVTTMRTAYSAFGPFPDGLSAGSGRIVGTAFFPGGDGLIYPRSSDLFPDILIVGHDFGTLGYLGACIAAGEERVTQPTWRGLLARLAAAKIEPQRCLFTNAFLGYRISGGNTDVFPARSDRDYIGRCRDFLGRQIDLVRPRAVVTLGKHVPSFLSALSPDLPWSSARNFAQIDRVGPIVANANFDGRRASVCALVHPSYGHLNVVRRRYRGRNAVEHIGVEAEVAMLRDVTAYMTP